MAHILLKAIIIRGSPRNSLKIHFIVCRCWELLLTMQTSRQLCSAKHWLLPHQAFGFAGAMYNCILSCYLLPFMTDMSRHKMEVQGGSVHINNRQLLLNDAFGNFVSLDLRHVSASRWDVCMFHIKGKHLQCFFFGLFCSKPQYVMYIWLLNWFAVSHICITGG